MKKVMLAGLLLGAASLLPACDGWGCGGAPGQGEVSLYVSDQATGEPVADVSFYEGQEKLVASCQEPAATNPKLCAYYILTKYPGTHVVMVKAPGYKTSQLQITLDAGDDLHYAVEIFADR
jgi:hypothetical protein